MQHDAPTTTIKFKPSKKRKPYRQRTDSPPQPTTSKTPSPEPNAESSITAAMRVRRKARHQGIPITTDQTLTLAKPPDNDHDKPVKGIPDRFMHQTGLISTLNDKHMNEYIESRLSRTLPTPETRADTLAKPADASHTPDQPTKHGKLVEVDVPVDMRDQRKRKLETENPRPKRGRNRRGSDDVKRDQLVEAFLHENKLDVYDFPVQNNTMTSGDGRSADDRMADEFRQRYLDEVAARRQKKRPVQQAKQQQQQQTGDVLRGPKLGGSRNQRAAARDMLLKQEKEKGGRRF
ncbi:mRNA splicing factor RNA helicase [Pochonia chlamydosporia 170]|uniref:mRNA splicing factor RNA helicase n=1 Tax=Pochonia chlamydosporia 170 TaxID=1380566 RepID=A0A179G3A3_METCM|nr:mRNA splicing factor RNA helicase [Pochonia chlamydosporia 170]OAQ72345.1 mRNA splicing factor RNA helicase [Pochonia chlamydosporia 170]